MLCVALSGEKLDQLGLPLMVDSNSALHGTQFTVTVDAIEEYTVTFSIDYWKTNSGFNAPGAAII